MQSQFAVALVAVAAISAGSQIAVAADMPVKARPSVVAVEPPLTWTGFYGGVSIGYADGKVTRGTPSDPNTTNLKPDSFVGAVSVGADYQFANNIVLGAKVTVPVFSLKDQTPSGGVTLGADVNWAVIAVGRLGYAFGPWLPYVMGGGVWGEGEASVVGIGNVTQNHTGYVVGGGLEYRVTRHISIDANYSYISMGKETYDFRRFGGLPVVHGFTSNNFMVGANFRL